MGNQAGLAVLDFSVSQVVRCRRDVWVLLHALCVQRAIPCVCIIAHDHVHAGPPPTGCGVTVSVVEPAACLGATEVGWCQCNGNHPASRLETTVYGSSMAVGITEYAFDAAAFVGETRRLVAGGDLPPDLVVQIRRPFPAADSGTGMGLHWLLRSLTLVRVGYGAL